MYYIYLLQSLKNQSFYIGYTSDLKRRFEEHNSGKSSATKPFRPYKLIFYEAFLNRTDAKNRETYLRSGWGWRSIKKILKNHLNPKSSDDKD
jgi:putative endonuclease